VEDGRKPLEAVSALTLLTWAAGLVPFDAQRSADEQSAVAWVLDLLCRSLEDAQRGTEMLVAISELLRQAPNIEDALNSELYFYSRVFGFALSDVDRETIVPFPIDNLNE
jgi:hypothetical protein